MAGKSPLCPVLLTMMLLVPLTETSALEIKGTFQGANIGFAEQRSDSDTSFTGSEFFWNGSLLFKQDMLGDFMVEGGLYKDLILRNVAFSLLQYKTDYFSVGLGTFLGVGNSQTFPAKSGISTLMRLELPGVVYVSFLSDNSLDGTPSETGDFVQRRNTLSLGISVFDAICSLSMDSKFFEIDMGDVNISDSLIDYSFLVEIYKKNVPFRVNLSFAYEYLLRNYMDGITDPTHGLHSLVLGAELYLNLSKSFSMVMGSDGAIYSWGSGQLAGFSDLAINPYLYRGYVGLVFNLAEAGSSGEGTDVREGNGGSSGSP